MHSGSRAEAEPIRTKTPLSGCGGQQDEPGLALSPDGPGASPEPPTLTNTPDGHDATATGTMASDLLRKLAERQETNCQGVMVKEEDQPMEVDAALDLVCHELVTEEMTTSTPNLTNQLSFTIKEEEEGQNLTSNKMADQLCPGAKMVDHYLREPKADQYYPGGCEAFSKMADTVISGANIANKLQFRVKLDNQGDSGAMMVDHFHSGARMEEQLVFQSKIEERFLSKAKISRSLLSGVQIADQVFNRHKIEDQLFFGAKMKDHITSGSKVTGTDLPRMKTEQQCFFGAKMEDQVASGSRLAGPDSPRMKMKQQHCFVNKLENPFHHRAKMAVQKLPVIKTEQKLLFGAKIGAQLTSGSRMASPDLAIMKMEQQCSLGTKMDYQFNPGVKMSGQDWSRIKTGHKIFYGAKMENQTSFGDRMVGPESSQTKMKKQFFFGAKMEDQFTSAAQVAGPELPRMKDQLFFGAKMEDHFTFGAKIASPDLCGMDQQLFFGEKMEDQLTSGAKMVDQCLRAVLWQDISVNLASTLLHQLSERVNKSKDQEVMRVTPPIRSSPLCKANVGQSYSTPQSVSHDRPYEMQISVSRNKPAGCSYFYRCHVCGFETDGFGLFQSHMMEHRQQERGSFSLHCCVCDHLTSQEEAMRAHVDTHNPADTTTSRGIRCPAPPPAATDSSAPTVAMATQQEKSTSEHRCRICQRSFPEQQEMLVHFQGHRQGNQYRCDRCGHLTRTANKLVEHVRVHTGERPFICDLCPYSAKRRDSLRLHCKAKHPAHVDGTAAIVCNDVHTHRSYKKGESQCLDKTVKLPQAYVRTQAAVDSTFFPNPSHPVHFEQEVWKKMIRLLPITTLTSWKPCPPSPSSSLSPKNTFMRDLGLKPSF
ncbi:uncharacterized protein LOC117504952 isoform X2 [Thalassophryne amazonica]|nr:uncharacterized protein LOC117504952 isoform X2 [Thalassophryne amazonica]